MLDGPMKDPTAMGWPQSVALLRFGAVQTDRKTRVHSGLLWGLCLALGVWAC
jgi:hypothetical protein